MHFITSPKLELVGFEVIFRSLKTMKIGNVDPKVGNPIMETLILNNDERIVGVKFQRPKNNYDWLYL